MPNKQQILLQDTNDAVLHSAKRCLGRFTRSSNSLFSVRFSEIIVGSEQWGTTRCRLTWRLKGTKRSRMYFHLHVINEEVGMWPTPRAQEPGKTSDGYGACLNYVISGNKKPHLLKTPSAMDAYSDRLSKKEQRFGNSGSLAQEISSGFVENRWPGLLQNKEMLPTPIAGDWKGQRRADGTASMLSGKAGLGLLPTPRANQVNGCDLNNQNIANRNKGNLEESVAKWVTNLLPTPTMNDGKNTTFPESQKGRHSLVGDAMSNLEPAKSSQLSPAFVMEMMGFPPAWTLKPYEK